MSRNQTYQGRGYTLQYPISSVEEREEAVARTIRASANWPDGSRGRYQKVIASVNI